MKKISQTILFGVFVIFAIYLVNYSLFSEANYCHCEPGYSTVMTHCEAYCALYNDDCLYFFPINFDGLCDAITEKCIYTYKFICARGGISYKSYETYCWECEDY